MLTWLLFFFLMELAYYLAYHTYVILLLIQYRNKILKFLFFSNLFISDTRQIPILLVNSIAIFLKLKLIFFTMLCNIAKHVQKFVATPLIYVPAFMDTVCTIVRPFYRTHLRKIALE
jgi:hypothetical protein